MQALNVNLSRKTVAILSGNDHWYGATQQFASHKSTDGFSIHVSLVTKHTAMVMVR